LTPSGSPTRPAGVAFGRGVSQVVANPGLVLAPLAFGGAMAACFVAAGFAVALILRVPAGLRGAARSLRDRRFSEFFEGLQGIGGSMPGTVVLILLGILVLGLALTAVAAWLRAGLTGALTASDARAPEGAPLDAFRLPSPGRAFFEAAGRLFGRFFALVNLYGLAATCLAALFLVPLAVLVAGAFGRRPAFLVVGGLGFFVALPVLAVGGAAARVVYLSACRAAAVDGLDALGAVARALEDLRAAPGRATVLYLLTVAGGMAVGLAFVVPRVFLTIAAGAAGQGAWAVFGISGLFFALQMTATLAYETVVGGAFVALWQPAPSAGDAVPAEISPS